MNSLSEEARQAILDLPDEALQHLQVTLTMPWQIVESRSSTDPDGKPTGDDDVTLSRDQLQTECWDKFNRNPQTNTAVRGITGRITGWGFETTSEVFEVQEAIEEIEEDPRNRLYHYLPKYVARGFIEGELFLPLTLHSDGFVEVDWVDPGTICKNGDDESGIIFHPRKKLMPLFYNVSDEKGGNIVAQIPSIFVARYPEVVKLVKGRDDFDVSKQPTTNDPKFKNLGGYNRFMISWDRGFCTRRTVSYLRTTIEWLNHYENLKKYEIDHKKSQGAYAWVFEFEDIKSFKLWLSLSDADRQKTGVMATFSPGCRLFLPPGMKLKAQNPQLANISESDTDILQMASSGLNESIDVMTGSLNATFASAKASRGPMSDRTSDEIAYFDRFYIFDFWGSAFFLKSAVSEFPKYFDVEEAIKFENGKAIFKTIKRRPEKTIEMSYPTSETVDLESRVKAVGGSKHGPLAESVGIPNSKAAKIIGFGGYGRGRLRKATEDKKFPKLVYSFDSDATESKQEKIEGDEPSKHE